MRGFTLIELSIVLVIIGLLVGGSLVGRDLIAAAQVRATVSQLEAYKAAAMTFKGKYRGIPGDLADATEFGLTTNGNGDGCVSACGVFWDEGIANVDLSGGAPTYAYESPAFWMHLAQAHLMNGQFDGDGLVAADSVGRTYPHIPLNVNVGLLAYTSLDVPYFSMISINGGWISGHAAVPPMHARQIDVKIDDGLPAAGMIVAVDSMLDGFIYEVYDSSTPPPALPLTSGWSCAYVPSGGTQFIYNVTDPTASCGLRIRGAF